MRKPSAMQYRPKDHKRLYTLWVTMKSKCSNPNHKSYRIYGARGIRVCDDWLPFDNFAKWMFDNGYDEQAVRGKTTIDRIDTNGNYSPDNCRIITIKQQQRNKNNNLKIPYCGRVVCGAELAEVLNMNYDLVRCLIAEGYSAEQIEAIKRMKEDGKISLN